MIRFLGMAGMGAGFLLISPALRASVAQVLGDGLEYMKGYSPYSYVACGLAALFVCARALRSA